MLESCFKLDVIADFKSENPIDIEIGKIEVFLASSFS